MSRVRAHARAYVTHIASDRDMVATETCKSNFFYASEFHPSQKLINTFKTTPIVNVNKSL